MKYKAQSQSPVAPVVNTDNKEFLHTYQAGALLQFLQASITAALFFVGAWLIGWLVFDLIDPIKPAVVLAVLAWIVTWLIGLLRWNSLATIERTLNVDLNRDGQIGNAQEPEMIRIQVNKVNGDGHFQQSQMDLPISREQLVMLANGLLDGMPFSENKWAGTGKPFSSNEFRRMRAIMIKRGLIELVSDKDPRQGFRLTEQGYEVMEYFAPPPADEETEDEYQEN